MDVIKAIKTFNAGRDPERLALKYTKMRGSAFAFMRGSCHLFYARLPTGGVFKSAPTAWICGDLHLENFGSFKGDNRLAYFDLNDFDEAALAPVSWDLVRMLTSIHLATAEGALRGMQTTDGPRLAELFLDAYAAALALGKPYWLERDTAQGLVRELLDELRGRERADHLDGRTTLKGKKRGLLTDGRRALPASEQQRKQVKDFMQAFAKTQDKPEFYKVLDVARRIAGNGSLGVPRFVVLVRGKGSPDGNYLLDLKQAPTSSLLPHLKAQLKTKQPRWPDQAQRIVELQRRAQAVSMAFLHPVTLHGQPFVLRALQPAEDRVDLSSSSVSPRELAELMTQQGRIVAWAHLRGAGHQGAALPGELMDHGQRSKWRAKLQDAALACAEQVRQDAAEFNAAFDEHALSDEALGAGKIN